MAAACTGPWSTAPLRSSRASGPEPVGPQTGTTLVPAGRRPVLAWCALCAPAGVLSLHGGFQFCFGQLVGRAEQRGAASGADVLGGEAPPRSSTPTPSSRLPSPSKGQEFLRIQRLQPPRQLLPLLSLLVPPADARKMNGRIVCLYVSPLSLKKFKYSNKYKFRMYKSLGTESSLWDTHIYRYQL